MTELSTSVKNAEVIFWDFDGVIKDTVLPKGWAFQSLFEEFGTDFCDLVLKHHLSNGGVTRKTKIKEYLSWAGLSPSNQLVDKYAQEFALRVKTEVLNAPYVDGFLSLALDPEVRAKFLVVSAVPQGEIEFIIQESGLANRFEKIFGAPNEKVEVVRKYLFETNFVAEDCLFFGDSKEDIIAAQSNSVRFILRQHEWNEHLLHHEVFGKVRDFIY